jgi:hypothetical protein
LPELFGAGFHGFFRRKGGVGFEDVGPFVGAAADVTLWRAKKIFKRLEMVFGLERKPGQGFGHFFLLFQQK